MKKEVTLKKICLKIANNMGYKPEFIEQICYIFINEIIKEVKQSNQVKIKNFGSFYTKKYKGRSKIDIKYQNQKSVDDYIALRFKVNSRLKQRLKDDYRNGKIKAYKDE